MICDSSRFRALATPRWRRPKRHSGKEIECRSDADNHSKSLHYGFTDVNFLIRYLYFQLMLKQRLPYFRNEVQSYLQLRLEVVVSTSNQLLGNKVTLAENLPESQPFLKARNGESFDPFAYDIWNTEFQIL